MKNLSIILVVTMVLAVLLGVFVIAHGYTSAHETGWRMDATAKALANAQLYQVESAEAAKRSQWFTAFYQVVGGLFVALVVVGSGLYGWVKVDERIESKNRAVDGSFALQTVRNSQGQQWIIDINKSQFGTIGFDRVTGQLVTDASIVGADRQLAYVKQVQKTRTASAVTSGEGFKYAATGKFLGGGYDKEQRPEQYNVVEPGLQSIEFKQLTALDAFEKSTQSEWILGQNRETGELFKFSPKESIGIVGSPSTGKTTFAAQLCFALAIKSKYRCVILDGKNGGDWSRFDQWSEYSPIDYTNIMEHLETLTAVYKQRQAILKQYDANSIWQLRDKGAKVPQPILVVCDEFGAVADGMKAQGRTAYASFELELGNLLRLGRSAGIYFVFCDQNPSKWCSTMRGVLTTNICFRLGGAVGQSVQEYNLNELDRTGHFQVQGQRYHGFATYEVIDSMLPSDYQKPKALLSAKEVASNETVGQWRTIDQNNDSDSDNDSDRGGGGFTTNTYPTVTMTDNDTSPVGNDSQSNSRTITGRPVTASDKQFVIDIHKQTGSYRKTCEIVWGSKTDSRIAWVKEIVQAGVM